MRRVKPLGDKRTIYSIHLQLSPALLAELERVAKRSKKTCAAVVRELVAAGLKRAA